MYIYGLNKENYLYNELVNQPQSVEGLINGRWHSESRLKYSDNRYQVIPIEPELTETTGHEPIIIEIKHELLDHGIDIESQKKDLLIKIKSLANQIITPISWKFERHEEQLILLGLGDPVNMGLTDDEYIAHLRHKQVLRDLSNLTEQKVKTISTEKALEEAKLLLNHNYTIPKIAKKILELLESK